MDDTETIEQIRAEVNAPILQPIPAEDVQVVQQQVSTEIPQIPQQQIPAESSVRAVTPTTPKHIEVYNDDEEEEDEDDDDDYDDDEEKDNSQKLVMDLDEDDEEEEEDDDEVDELEKDEIQQSANDPLEPIQKPEQQSQEKEVTSTAKTEEIKPKENIEAIITLSDAEEETAVAESTIKPGKVQKRKSVGATTTNHEEERYRLKRRKINAEGAPKMPLTGYVRFMNDRRESVRKDHPSKNSIEVTKVIAEEWQALPSDVKSEYLKAAEVDKQRYLKELHTFLKSRPDILASELAKNKIRKTDTNNPNASANLAKQAAKDKTQSNDAKVAKETVKEKAAPKEPQPIASTSTQNSEKPQSLDKSKRKRTPTPTFTNATSSTSSAAAAAAAAAATASGPSTSAAASISAVASNSSAPIVTPTSGEIPIFTTEFLEHNKIYDMELRSLRKSKTDLEQQNFVLEKHVENMKCGVEKMQSENNELQEKNRLLEIYLDKLKRKLAQALGTLPLPCAPNGATVENIDKYMQDLYKMSSSNSHGPATLNKAKDIIRKLDLQIQL